MADEKNEKDLNEKVAALRARKAQREKAAEVLSTVAELQRLELEERFEAELGPLGSAYVIVDVSDLGEGFVVLKLGEGVLWNTFKSSKMNVVDTEAFVLPNVVHPSRDEYRALAARRGFVPERCAGELATLYGVKLKADGGK